MMRISFKPWSCLAVMWTGRTSSDVHRVMRCLLATVKTSKSKRSRPNVKKQVHRCDGPICLCTVKHVKAERSFQCTNHHSRRIFHFPWFLCSTWATMVFIRSKFITFNSDAYTGTMLKFQFWENEYLNLVQGPYNLLASLRGCGAV